MVKSKYILFSLLTLIIIGSIGAILFLGNGNKNIFDSDRTNIDPILSKAEINYNCTELLVSTTDYFHTNKDMAQWTQDDYDEWYQANTRQGYVIDAKYCGQEWGRLERQPNRNIIIRIDSDYWDKKYLQPEYDDPESEYRNITKDKEYRIPIELLLSNPQKKSINDLEYNELVDWNITLDYTGINITQYLNKFEWEDMPPTVKRHGSSGLFSVCTTGCDYTSLVNFEANEEADIRATGPAIATISESFVETADTLLISGWTTNGTGFIAINTTGEADHSGIYDESGGYLLNITGTTAGIDFREEVGIIENFQINHVDDDASGSYNIEFDPASASIPVSVLNITNMILSTNRQAGGVTVNDGGTNTYIKNSLIFYDGTQGNLSEGIYFELVGNGFVENTVIYNFEDGIETDSGNSYINNSVVFENVDDFDNPTAVTFTASDDSQAGEGNINGLTWANEFEDHTNFDFRLKSGSNLIDNGTTLTAFSDDIVGTSRPQGFAWDIGAFEFYYPNISFVSPTPANATSQSTLEVNISIEDDKLNEVIYNWDGTNYTLFNDSVVLMMNFDNVSALGESDTLVLDVSGNWNNGTVVGATWNSTGGKYNGAFEFDGGDDYIQLPQQNSLKPTEQIGISAWVRAANSNNVDPIIVWDGGSTDAYELWLKDSGSTDQLSFAISNGSKVCSVNYVMTAGTIVNNQWYHIVANYDGSFLEIYMDGIRVNKTEENYCSGDINYGVFGEKRAEIFRDGSFYREGALDDLNLLDRALTPEEVNQSYMSNLRKYDLDKWLLYVNQTDNAGDSLSNGTYSYQGFVKNLANGPNSTEYREITIGEAGDTFPTYSDNQENGTLAGSFILHALKWTDDVDLSGYIFSWNNGSGTFTNDSFTTSFNANWSNVTKWINTTVGTTISWCVYANDSTNQLNSTSCASPFTYVTTAEDTCSPTSPLSADYTFDCNDYCNITDNLNSNGYIIHFDGSGIITWEANITNVSGNYPELHDSCRVSFHGGNGII